MKQIIAVIRNERVEETKRLWEKSWFKAPHSST
jgi:nitrogen regulatory protein PII